MTDPPVSSSSQPETDASSLLTSHRDLVSYLSRHLNFLSSPSLSSNPVRSVPARTPAMQLAVASPPITPSGLDARRQGISGGLRCRHRLSSTGGSIGHRAPPSGPETAAFDGGDERPGWPRLLSRTETHADGD